VVRLRRTTWPSELADRVRAAATADGVRHDDVLAAIEAPDGWAAGTRSAVYLPTVGHTVRRVPWEQVERAEWNADKSTLHLWEAAPFGTPMRRTDLAVDDPGRFGQLVRERINASVLVQRHVPLAGNRGVRVVGRRSPAAAEPEVTWSLVLDDGLDPDQPGLLDRAEDALRQVRDEFGM
jgi:hypothetical protein